jgi:hypothetical protein
MKITRLVELSIYYKLQDSLSNNRTGDIAKTTDYTTYSLKYNNILPNHPVIVYKNNIVFNSNNYTIDYTNGLIRFNVSMTLSDEIKVDYTYCLVNIYDEGTSPLSNDFKYPAVSVVEDTAIHHPFELGNSNREKHAYWIFQVWSERGGERNDLTDSLVDVLKENFIIIDYNQGFPLSSDGSKNITFDSNQIIGYATPDSINYSKGGSLDIGDKPKYFTEIHAVLIYYA